MDRTQNCDSHSEETEWCGKGINCSSGAISAFIRISFNKSLNNYLVAKV